MNVPVQRVYQRCDRKEIAHERVGSAVKIPRAEFQRQAERALYRDKATEEALAATAEIEKAARKLRQVLEPGA